MDEGKTGPRRERLGGRLARASGWGGCGRGRRMGGFARLLRGVVVVGMAGWSVSRAGVNPRANGVKPAEAQYRSNKNEGVTESGRFGLFGN